LQGYSGLFPSAADHLPAADNAVSLIL
jgi:hypothetical protein